MPRLLVIIGSTRPGRIGLPIGTWFHSLALADGRFEVDLVDLLELNLPFLDEPKHPILREYEHEHTKRWSAHVDAADAFVLVTPEYNFSMVAPVKNAFDYLHQEWRDKPMAFVSYGGASGGLRATEMTKQTVTALRMMPIYEQVSIQFAKQHVEDGVFTPTESHTSAAHAMLAELATWAAALKQKRLGASAR